MHGCSGSKLYGDPSLVCCIRASVAGRPVVGGGERHTNPTARRGAGFHVFFLFNVGGFPLTASIVMENVRKLIEMIKNICFL